MLVLLLAVAGVRWFPLPDNTSSSLPGRPATSELAVATPPMVSLTATSAVSQLDIHAVSTNLNQGFRQEIDKMSYHQQGGPGVTATQWKEIGNYLTVASEASQALANDDGLTAAKLAISLSVGLPLLRQKLGRSHPWSPVLAKVVVPATWATTTDLAQARADFGVFSVGLVDWVRVMRRAIPQLAPLKVYTCLIDTTPAVWFQMAAPIQNPYYGSNRLDYGTEVLD